MGQCIEMQMRNNDDYHSSKDAHTDDVYEIYHYKHMPVTLYSL